MTLNRPAENGKQEEGQSRTIVRNIPVETSKNEQATSKNTKKQTGWTQPVRTGRSLTIRKEEKEDRNLNEVGQSKVGWKKGGNTNQPPVHGKDT